MKRPVGVTILGMLWIFAGGGGLLSPLRKPLLSFDMIHTGIYASLFHVVANSVAIYLGYGVLKPLRHIWYLYALLAGVGLVSLSVNILHESKIWELYLLLQA